MNRLDEILAVVEVNQTSLQMRFGRRLLAALFDHFDKTDQRLGIAALPLEQESLLIKGLLNLGCHRRSITPAATHDKQHGGKRKCTGNSVANSHLGGKGIEWAIAARRFRQLFPTLKL